MNIFIQEKVTLKTLMREVSNMPYCGLFGNGNLQTQIPRYAVQITTVSTIVCSMTHYDITMGNTIAWDVHYDILLFSCKLSNTVHNKL